jgi:pseudouridine-5'-phosphate glycosidase
MRIDTSVAVATAIDAKQPLVALESTVIAHWEKEEKVEKVGMYETLLVYRKK